MAYETQYQVVQKPLAERLIDATCIYFKIDNKDKLKGELIDKRKSCEFTQERQVLMYLLSREAELTLSEIAKIFNRSKSNVSRDIDAIESSKGIYRTINEHIKQITAISITLDYKMVTIIQSIQ
jgi:chromosomal replication initiation ATPase DnaA